MKTFAVHFQNMMTGNKGTMPVSASTAKEARQKFLVSNRNSYLKITSVRRVK